MILIDWVRIYGCRLEGVRGGESEGFVYGGIGGDYFQN